MSNYMVCYCLLSVSQNRTLDTISISRALDHRSNALMQLKIDLKLRKEIGNLMIHTGTITRLAFIGKSHLISASQGILRFTS